MEDKDIEKMFEGQPLHVKLTAMAMDGGCEQGMRELSAASAVLYAHLLIDHKLSPEQADRLVKEGIRIAQPIVSSFASTSSKDALQAIVDSMMNSAPNTKDEAPNSWEDFTPKKEND